MQIEAIDIIFWIIITVIVLGGLTCLVIFLPREHEYEESKADCYRIMYRDGVYSVSQKSAKFGENVYSIRSKYFYIKKAPFQVTAICDEAEAPDGKKYRAADTLTVCFPEDKLQVFAPTFHNVPHDSVVETIEEALTSAMEETLKSYSTDETSEALKERFKAAAKDKLDIFGVYIMNVSEVRVTENK